MTFVMTYTLGIYDFQKTVMPQKGIQRETMTRVGRNTLYIYFFQLEFSIFKFVLKVL